MDIFRSAVQILLFFLVHIAVLQDHVESGYASETSQLQAGDRRRPATLDISVSAPTILIILEVVTGSPRFNKNERRTEAWCNPICR